MAHKLRVALKPKPPRRYATILPSEFRNLSLSDEMPYNLKTSLERVMERLDSHPPYSFVFYDEPAHNGCDGGWMLVDILSGCLGGQVLEESAYAGFIPDIAVYPPNASDPSCVIEVVDTSPPSVQKLKELKRRGVEVYQLNASKENPQVILEEPVIVDPLVTQRCGQSLRHEVWNIARFWQQATEPFVGIRFFPSGTQEYLYGERADDTHNSWNIGKPEVRGLARWEVAWPSVQHVTPVGRPRTISRELFMAYLMWLKTWMIQAAHHREARLEDSPAGHIRLSQVESITIKHIEDLMHMVRFPEVKP